MSAAFTPGPWSFDGPPDSRIVWAGGEHRVCFLTSDGPNLANARLIASAPDLYAALDLARNRLRAAAINEAPKGSAEYYQYSQWADEADAALAKIGG
jgi:hypothetical protein